MPPTPPLFLSRFRLALAVWLAVVLGAAGAWAHNPMASWAVARLTPDSIELDVELSLEAAMALLGTPMGTAPAPADATSLLGPLKKEADAGGVYRVRAAGRPLAATSTIVELREEDGVGFKFRYRPAAESAVLFDAAFLAQLKPEHRSAFTVLGSGETVLQSTVLAQASPTIEYKSPSGAPGPNDTPTQPATAETEVRDAGEPPSHFQIFLKLGIEHILLGYDHLLFLGGLLLACRRLKTMAAIITCFTVAHSITLALAALDVATLPSRIVEPLIAASIVFVGVENILRRNEEPKGRWVLTFVFGLVHGFGFASVLREIGFGTAGEVIVPLFAFNLGVELGQLAVMLVAVAFLWPFRERPAFARYARPALSVIVAAAGAVWLTQRLLHA
ncbi:MAG TPA: HupE/UreJ family protein [Opitutaceae bacterium]